MPKEPTIKDKLLILRPRNVGYTAFLKSQQEAKEFWAFIQNLQDKPK